MLESKAAYRNRVGPVGGDVNGSWVGEASLSEAIRPAVAMVAVTDGRSVRVVVDYYEVLRQKMDSRGLESKRK
jgi:hypothetical protein